MMTRPYNATRRRIFPRAEMLRLIHDARPGETQLQLAVRVGTTPGTITTHLRWLAADGLVHRGTKHKQVHPSLGPSRLTEAGHALLSEAEAKAKQVAE